MVLGTKRYCFLKLELCRGFPGLYTGCIWAVLGLSRILQRLNKALAADLLEQGGLNYRAGLF